VLKNAASKITSIVLRGSTKNILDDAERAVNDAVASYKVLTKDSRYVVGAGCIENNLASVLLAYGSEQPGLD